MMISYKKILILITTIVLLMLIILFFIPHKDKKSSLTDEMVQSLFKKNFMQEMINDLPKSLLIYIAKKDVMDELIAIDPSYKTNSNFGTLIMKNKKSNEKDYYLFNYFTKNRYVHVPFKKEEVLFKWNNEDYLTVTHYLEIDGLTFFNQNLHIATTMDHFILYGYQIPSNTRRFEGFSWFYVQKHGDGDVQFKSIYKGFNKEIKSIPVYLKEMNL